MSAGRRPHGAVYALLAVSLAANLVGAGYVVGTGFADYRSGGKHPRPPRTVESTIDFVSNRYPKPVAGAVKAKLEGRRDELKAAIDDMRASKREIRRTMTEEPLDRARVEAAFEVSRQKAEAFQRVVQRAVLDALPDVPQSQRGAMEKDDDPD